MWASQGFTRVYRYVVASMVHEELCVRVSGPTICTSRLSIIFSKVKIPEIVIYSPYITAFTNNVFLKYFTSLDMSDFV